MTNRLRKQTIGKKYFSGKIDITDPCYNKDVWCRTTATVKDGEYSCVIWKSTKTYEIEGKEHKYDKQTHPARFEVISKNWDAILKITDEELPTVQKISEILNTIGIPTDLNNIGVDRQTAILTFKSSKDMRDKYVLSRLAWDLGVLDELCELL